jgi:hypothetical protein
MTRFCRTPLRIRAGGLSYGLLVTCTTTTFRGALAYLVRARRRGAPKYRDPAATSLDEETKVAAVLAGERPRRGRYGLYNLIGIGGSRSGPTPTLSTASTAAASSVKSNDAAHLHLDVRSAA